MCEKTFSTYFVPRPVENTTYILFFYMAEYHFKIILVLVFKGSSVQGTPYLSMEHNQLPFPACGQTPVQTSQSQSHQAQSE